MIFRSQRENAAIGRFAPENPSDESIGRSGDAGRSEDNPSAWMPERRDLFPRNQSNPETWEGLRKPRVPGPVLVDQGQTYPSPWPSRGNFVFDQLIEGLSLSDECEGTVFFS